jgi:tape measure domain-containing protein
MPDKPSSDSGTVVPTEKHQAAIRWGLVLAGVAVFVLTIVLLFLERQTSDVRVWPQGPSSAAATQTITTSSVSDTVLLGFLGLGALLILSGAFFARITKLVGPGGMELDVAAELPAATNAVKQHEQATATIAAAGQPSLSSDDKARAMVQAAAYAAQLKRVAKTSPGQLSAVAATLGMTQAEIAHLMLTGTLDTAAWSLLADASLKQVRGSAAAQSP